MPNLTQTKYRRLYEIYPDKACIEESAVSCSQCLGGQIHSLGRFVGRGPGGRGVNEAPVSVSPDVDVQLVQLQE
jgi:hypothetical protein